MNKVCAIYENGLFRPTCPVELPDHCRVEFEPRVVEQSEQEGALDDVYTVLSERYQSGQSDVSGRHNEHQP